MWATALYQTALTQPGGMAASVAPDCLQLFKKRLIGGFEDEENLLFHAAMLPLLPLGVQVSSVLDQLSKEHSTGCWRPSRFSANILQKKETYGMHDSLQAILVFWSIVHMHCRRWKTCYTFWSWNTVVKAAQGCKTRAPLMICSQMCVWNWLPEKWARLESDAYCQNHAAGLD